MIARARRVPRGLVFLVATLAFFLIAPQIWGAGSITSSNYTDVSDYLGTFGVIALAVGLGMVVGEFDISVGASYVLGGVVAVKLGQSSALVGLLAAAAVGAFAGFVQGVIVGRFKISSVPVTLAGFIVMSGIAVTISGGQQLLYEDYATVDWLNEIHFTYLTTNGMIVGGIFILLALVFALTRIGPTMRAVGGDRRASEVAGIRTTRTLALTMGLGGLVAAAGGGLHAFTSSAAVSDVSFEPLIDAVIAAVIGGVAITGGEGSPLGIAAGVLSLGFLQEAFVVMGSDSNLVTIVTGGFLLLVAVASAAEAGSTIDWLRGQRDRLAMSGRGRTPRTEP
jgi:ribose/xylose/arabinose/galactoside ABC-type transport system permease subunit